MSAELPADLAALIAAAGVPLVEATPLSRRGPEDRPTTWRLRFADGAVRKASVLSSVAHAERVAALAAELGDGAPRLLGRRGATLLGEWVDGPTLADAAGDEAWLPACGAWHGRVHGLRRADDAAAAALLARWRRRLAENLEVLRAAGLLDAATAAAGAALAARHAPARCDAALSLGDLSPENLVRRPSGAPCLIDIETLDVAPSDYDLARTWYRWPMAATQRAAYLDGYRRHRDPAAFLAHRRFWVLAALANGVVFRLRERATDVGVPLTALNALLRRPDAEA